MSRKTAYIALSQFCEEDQSPLKLLESAGFDIKWNKAGRRPNKEELINALKESDAVLAGVEIYDEDVLKSSPRLKCISRCGVGTDAIDHAAAKRSGVAVLNTPDEVVEPVAQMTLAMILALARRFPHYQKEFSQGLWKKHTGFLLSEWTIGLLGFGRIGRLVEKYLRPMAPRLIVHDPYLKQKDLPDGVTWMDLPEFLAQSDLVSIHVSRSADAGPVLGGAELQKMKRGSFLVNTSRGFLIDEKALHDSLAGGHLAGAALDVFEKEPYSGPLCALPQVLGTPHVSSLARASRIAMEKRCAQNVVDFFK